MPRPQLRALFTAALLITFVSVPALAQRGGTVEIVPLARYSLYPDSLQLKHGMAVGAELGWFVTRKLSLEIEGNYGVTSLPDSTSVSTSALAARLLIHLPLQGRATALFGIGYAQRRYDRGLDAVQEGPGGLVGLRLGFGPRLGLRLESTIEYVAESGAASEREWDVGAQVGLSIYAGPLGARDSDRDGVSNEDDRCASTAADMSVDLTGCPLPRDTDGDGVLDGTDRCPATLAGQRVDLTGCNADLDSDGVPNALDRCTATSAGTAVDQFGCPPSQPPADTDGDGVPDERDRCPGTSAGLPVDALGCAVPVVEPQPPPPARLILHDVTFPTGSSKLDATAKASLRLTAASILSKPAVQLEVAGYTDDTGTRTVNERISQARAESVRAFLISEGVPADQLTARGYGPADPIASNETPAGRALNRRVELKQVE